MNTENDTLSPKLSELIRRKHFETARATLELLDPLCIAQRTGVAPNPYSKYTLIKHSELCRLKLLGMNDTNAAIAIGVTPETLRSWFKQIPSLKEDMDCATQLAIASVAQLLTEFMQEPGAVGLNAVKFFLTTHADEFREKAELKITSESDMKEIENAIRIVFGITINDNADNTTA